MENYIAPPTLEVVLTYQTRIGHSPALDEYGDLYNVVLHYVYNEVRKGKCVNKIQNETIKKYNISRRMYSSIRMEVAARIDSAKENLILSKENKEIKIKQLKKEINDFETKLSNKKVKNREKLNDKLFNKRNKLIRIVSEFNIVEQKLELDIPPICFGSLHLFKEQHYHPTEYKNSTEWKEKDLVNWKKYHNEWLCRWQNSRNNNIYSIGTWNEIGGNSNCIASIQENKDKKGNNLISLRVRLPDEINQGKYLILNDLQFNHGHKDILDMIKLHESDEKKEIVEYRKANKIKTKRKNIYEPMNYRFVRDEKGWSVQCTITKHVPRKTSTNVIGIDFNNGFITLAVIKPDGNIISKKDGLIRINCNNYGKSTGQTEALLGKVIQVVRDLALKYNAVPIIENLDFADLKMTSNHRALVSHMPYGKFRDLLIQSLKKEGIEIKKVNPAYTSFVGRNKYMKQYGISVHSAAAIIIGRRFLGMNEELINNKFMMDCIKPLSCELPDRMKHENWRSYIGAVYHQYTYRVNQCKLVANSQDSYTGQPLVPPSINCIDLLI